MGPRRLNALDQRLRIIAGRAGPRPRQAPDPTEPALRRYRQGARQSTSTRSDCRARRRSRGSWYRSPREHGPELVGPLLLGARGVGMGANSRAVDHHFFQVAIGADPLKYPILNALLGPARKPGEGGVPRTERGRQVASGYACAPDPQHRFGKPSIVAGGHARIAIFSR